MADTPSFPNSRGPHGIASARYAQGISTRQPFLDRARQNAALTIPWLFREEGANGTTAIEIPWNSSGQYMVANMGAKLILVLFPVGRAPMKLKPGQDTQVSLLAMAASDPDKAGALAASIDLGLSGVEQEFVECVDEDGDRAKLAIGALKLLVGGNHGFQFYDDATMRGISLERFCTWRDAAGNLLEFVIEDSLAYETLPEVVQAHVKRMGYTETDDIAQANESIKVYTRGHLKGGLWRVSQECYGELVEGSDYTRRPEALDYFFPGWQFNDAEHYARAYVDGYIGDFQTVEGLTQTVTEGAAAIAAFIRMVAPGGLTSKKALAEARNGDIISGRKDDVATVEGNKGADYQSALSVKADAEKRLSAAFLLNSSVQRAGERVTAEEIRFVSQELEDAQAGAYSQQVVTWQMPYVKSKLRYLMKGKRVTPLPMDSVKVTIVGGMGGLARNAELAALDNLVTGTLQLFGPTAIERINLSVYYQRRAAALGVKVDGLIYSEEAVEEKQQQMQQQQLISQVAPEAVKQIGANITDNQVAETQAASRAAPAAPQPRAQ